VGSQVIVHEDVAGPLAAQEASDLGDLPLPQKGGGIGPPQVLNDPASDLVPRRVGQQGQLVQMLLTGEPVTTG